jgi:hypothetical protein
MTCRIDASLRERRYGIENLSAETPAADRERVALIPARKTARRRILGWISPIKRGFADPDWGLAISG